jgi:hypothetical protein
MSMIWKVCKGQGDHTLFIKHSPSRGVTAFLVYVDDIIVTGDDDKERQILRKCLAKEFEIKALREDEIFYWDRGGSL